MKPHLAFLAMALASAISTTTQAQPSLLSETGKQHNARMQWWREARFGLFIHWGVYSVPAGEWQGKTNFGEWFMEETRMPVSQYEQYARQFNPARFDARQWVRMAQNAGMKYIVITSKHHDGFGMFRSELTDWCIRTTPFARDPLKELADACREAGLQFCFYHSIMDWRHPDWGTRRAWNDRATGQPDMDRYIGFMKGQLQELLTRYGPIGVLWFDGEWESPWTHDRGVDLYNYVRSLQPNIIINNRVGKGRAGMNGMNQGKSVGDFGTPEQEIPATGFGPGEDWESCMTMNNHWGYNKHDQQWKSTQTLIRNLIDCASKGGNYLLNVGPTSEGLFPEASVQRLEEIGRWMKINGQAIYATSASPFKRLPWGRCTKKLTSNGAILYLHVFTWPTDQKLLVPGLRNPVKKAFLLGQESVLSTQSSADGVIVTVPAVAPDPISSTVVLRIQGTPDIDPAAPLAQESDGSILLPAVDANLHGETIRFETSSGKDNIGYWTNPQDWVDWTFRVSQPGRFKATAEIAAQGAGSFIATLGGQSLKATAPVTGDYARFTRIELGAIEIAQPGKTILAVKPIVDGWQPINLKSIRLTREP